MPWTNGGRLVKPRPEPVMPLKPDQVAKFAKYFVSRKTVQTPKGAYHLLQALHTLTTNKSVTQSQLLLFNSSIDRTSCIFMSSNAWLFRIQIIAMNVSNFLPMNWQNSLKMARVERLLDVKPGTLLSISSIGYFNYCKQCSPISRI